MGAARDRNHERRLRFQSPTRQVHQSSPATRHLLHRLDDCGSDPIPIMTTYTSTTPTVDADYTTDVATHLPQSMLPDG